MDPTLTRSQAHQVFGDLYRKSRSPELQAEVDRVVDATTDVFVRIKRIEEIDAGAEKDFRQKEREGQGERSGQDPSNAGKGGSAGGGRGRDRSSRPAARSTPAPSGPKKAKKTNRPQTGRLGFLAKWLGGELAIWGNSTGALHIGLFGLNVSISQRVADIFTSLKEEQIISTIKCFRAVMKGGWERWEPLRYNTIVAGYQFFSEFVKVPAHIKKMESPAIWVNETLKLQRTYAMLLEHPDYKNTLTDELPKLAALSEELLPHVANLRSTMNYIVSLENRSPSLIDGILGFYALINKKIYTWDDIKRQVGVQDPILGRYRAPESVLSVINGRIKKYKETITIKEGEIKEIEEIRKNYFQFDESGRIRVEFLNGICEGVLRKTFSEKLVTENSIKTYKTQPPKLLFVIMRDFDLVIIPLLTGTVTLKSGGSSEEALLFKQGLFRALHEEINALHREVDQFNKSNNTFVYSFKEFKDDLSKGTQDATVIAFLQLVKRLNQMVRVMVFDLKTVMDNHRNAVEKGKMGKENDKLQRTASIPIETFDIGMRYLPYYDRTIISSYRMNGKSVESCIQEILMNLYNYLYIFRDGELIRTMSSVSAIHTEIGTLKMELKRMGVED